MTRSAPDMAVAVLKVRWMWRFIAIAAAISLTTGLIWRASGQSTSGDFERVSSETVFDSRFMPFGAASPLISYGGIGSSPWVTVVRSGRPTHLDVSTLRLHESSPASAQLGPGSNVHSTARAERILTADDVRALWSSRKAFGAVLDFDRASESLQKALSESGRLPAGSRVRILARDVYSEAFDTAGGAVALVLRRQADGSLVTIEEPVPTSAEPLFHDVFKACVRSQQAVRPPWTEQVLGQRYERDKRCGLMSNEGKWLARPEFQFMEAEYGPGHYFGTGPYLLLLRGDEPCISTLQSPVKVACLGKPLSSLLEEGYLPFRNVSSHDARRAGDAIGFVSARGEWVIQPRFREAQAFSGKVTSVQIAGLPAVIDRSGKWITPPVPTDPIVATWLDLRGSDRLDRAGLINRSGEMVIPLLFARVERRGEAKVQVCHHACSPLELPPATDPEPVKPISVVVDPALVATAGQWVPTGEDGRWGFQDASGRWVIQPSYEEAEPFDAGLAKVRLKNSWGLILPTGQWLHPAEYQWIGPLTHGVAVAQGGDAGYVLLRADGKRIPIPDDGEVLSAFGSDGLAVAGRHRDRGVGYLNRDGEWAISPRFSFAEPFSGGYAMVKGQPPVDWRPANLKEPPYILRSIHWLSREVMALRALVDKEERVGLMDRDGNWLIPTK